MKDPAVHLDGRIRDSSVGKYGGIKEGQMWPMCVKVKMHINVKFLCPLSEIEKVKLSPRHIK